MIGEHIDGKYVVTGQIGAGAMGAVYAARNIATGRSVAVKVIQNGLGTDPALLARFQREARAAGAIQSTYIAQVLDAGHDRTTDAPYLVMELLEGEDLDTFVRRLGAVRFDLALRIIAQALAGLERAHAVGVVHRDIKPANLYIARADAGQRVVKLVDFGIAKVKDEFAASNHALTQTSALLGSPLYMSPEQAKASKKVDARADLWSLGIVLYQLLTGHAPHAHAESLTELLLAICTEDVKPVQQAAPWVPAEVAAIVERALRLDPTKRFDDAKQMRDAIEAIVPSWQVLTDAMLTPLTSEERAFVAQPTADFAVLAASTGPAAGGGTGASISSSGGISNSALALGGATELGPMPGRSSSQHSAPALAASAGASGSVGLAASTATGDGVTGPRGARSGGPRAVMIAAAGGLLVVAAIGGGLGLRARNKPIETVTGMISQPSAVASGGALVAEPTVAPAASALASASAVPVAASTESAPRPAEATTPAGAPRGRPSPSAGPSTTTTATAATSAATARPATAPARPATPATASSSPISREFN